MSEPQDNYPLATAQKPADNLGFPNPLNPFAPSGGGIVCWSTLNTNDPEQAILYQRAKMMAQTNFDQWIGKTFIAVHCMSHPYSMADKATGEVYDGMMVKLIGADGVILCWGGRSATQCIQTIASMECVGLPPWRNGLPLNVGQVKSRNGNILHTLRVDDEYLRQATAAQKQPAKQRK